MIFRELLLFGFWIVEVNCLFNLDLFSNKLVSHPGRRNLGSIWDSALLMDYDEKLRSNFDSNWIYDERELIVGATNASTTDFPWYVATTGNGFCGGALVSSTVVMSAAHCADLFAIGSYLVVGASVKNALAGTGQARKVKDLLPHPQYNSDNLGYDYLLILLDTPVYNVQPLAWNANKSMPVVGTQVTVMGFGKIGYQDSAPISLTLLKTNLFILSDTVCLQRFGQYAGSVDLTSMICADDENPNIIQSSCQGDSGGPLVAYPTDRSGNKYALLVGIVSWGIGCGNTGYPQMYSRPSGAAQWLQNNICRFTPGCANYTNATDTTGASSSNSTFTFKLSIIFQYDANPQQTTWALVQVLQNGSQQNMGTGPPSTPTAYSTWQYSVTNLDIPEGNYMFVVYDSAGDGLENGSGYKIVLETSSGKSVVATGPKSSFTYQSSSKVFSVSSSAAGSQPSQPTSPTMAPTFGNNVCACLAGTQVCRPQICRTATNRTKCLSFGCTWLDGSSNSSGPSNIETGTNTGFNDLSQFTDAQKAGISILVGVGVSVVSFMIMGAVAYFYMRLRKRKELQQTSLNPPEQAPTQVQLSSPDNNAEWQPYPKADTQDDWEVMNTETAGRWGNHEPHH